MTFTRSNLLLSVALGTYLCGFGVVPAFAQSGSGHSHAEGSHADGHDHDAATAEKEIQEALAALTPEDRNQAMTQRFCPIMEYTRLGATETPLKVMVEGTPVLVCCEGCIEDAQAGGKETLAVVSKLTKASYALATLSAADRAAAEAQKYCVIAKKSFLGSMGVPVKLDFDGQSVFVCCKGCAGKANADPAAALARAKVLREAGEDHDHDDHDHAGHDHGDHDHSGHDHSGHSH